MLRLLRSRCWIAYGDLILRTACARLDRTAADYLARAAQTVSARIWCKRVGHHIRACPELVNSRGEGFVEVMKGVQAQRMT
jgi:hypothetical protein